MKRRIVKCVNALKKIAKHGVGSSIQGFACENPVGCRGATVVTAYYPMPSKFPRSRYIEWMRNFFLSVKDPIVVFTDQSGKKILDEVLSKLSLSRAEQNQIQIINKPIISFSIQTLALSTMDSSFSESAKLSLEKFWQWQLDMDPEFYHHSPALYSLWLEKPRLCLDAAMLNPFNSKFFVWIDIGIFRDPVVASKESRRRLDCKKLSITEDKVVFLDVFGDAERQAVKFVRKGTPSEVSDFIGSNQLGGGFIASTFVGWNNFYLEFSRSVGTFLADKSYDFIGKDQSLFNFIYLESPEIFHLIKGDNGSWDYMINYFFEEHR